MVMGQLSPDCHSLVIDNGSRIARMFKHLADVPLEITFKKFYRKRTLAQNRWIWGICVPAVMQWLWEDEGIRYSKEAVYAYLRIKVLKQEVQIISIMGFDVPVIEGKRFSAMTTIEFSDSVEVIVLHYAEQGREVPLPKPKTNNLLTDHINDD